MNLQEKKEHLKEAIDGCRTEEELNYNICLMGMAAVRARTESYRRALEKYEHGK